MAVELLTMGNHPGIGIMGVTGNVVRTVGSGTLDLAFFLRGRLLSRPMGGPGATVFSMPTNVRVRRGRVCAFSPIRSAKMASLLGFREIEGHSGVFEFPVSPHTAYGASIAQRAGGKASARRRELNQVSATIWEHTPRGFVWWTDLSNSHVPDYQGNMYARMFAEEGTGYVRLLFCATKSTAGLLTHLLNMERWVTKMVPGGQFMVIRCDFGSELVRQGHGNDMVMEALARW